MSDKLKPFQFHGLDVDVETTKDEQMVDCPWCGREKLNILTDSGKFRCVVCETSGNYLSFMRKLHEHLFEDTDDEQYKKLIEERPGLTISALRAWQVAYNPFNDTWVIPAYNPQGQLANLFKCTKVIKDEKPVWVVYSTPGRNLYPMKVQNRIPSDRVFVVEGPWDGIAAHSMLNSLRKTREAVVAIPGATSFKELWVKDQVFIEPTDVIIVGDNDHPRKTTKSKTLQPGWHGSCKSAEILNKIRKKGVFVLKWGPNGFDKDLPDGYDVRDLINDRGAKAAYQFLCERSERISHTAHKRKKVVKSSEPVELEPVDCHSFDDLLESMRERLYVPQTMADTMAVMYAVTLSTTIDGDQLWFRVIGPPSSGKSTLSEMFAVAKEYVIARSVLTGFHSGYETPGKKDEDASLIPKLRGKTLIIKDADTLVSGDGTNRILSEMRDIYDGTSRAEYRNKKKSEYSGLRTTFIICGTDELRSLNRSFLGERFLDVEIMEDDPDITPFTMRAIKNAVSRFNTSVSGSDHDENLYTDLVPIRQKAYGFISYLKTALEEGEIVPPTFSENAEARIVALATILSFMRASSNRYKDTKVQHRSRIEMPYRLIGQLTKLAQCLAVVLGRKSVDNEVLRIVAKVVKDTSKGYKLDILSAISEKPSGLDQKYLVAKLEIPQTTCTRILVECREFRVLKSRNESNNSGIRGRDRHVFTFTPEFKQLWITAFGAPSKRPAPK